MTEHADAEKAAEEWATLSVGEVPADRIMAPFSYLTLWKRDKKMLKEGFLAGAAWAAPKWISVKERLPEECCDVLAAIWDPYDRVHWYDVVGWGGPDVDKWLDYEMATHDNITHWMPLPAAPKEEK